MAKSPSPWWIPFFGKKDPYQAPELEGLDPAEKLRVWKVARRGMRRSVVFWVGQIVFFAAIVFVPELTNNRFWMNMFVGLLAIEFFLLTSYIHLHARFRRNVRAELGTHCPICDYDWRLTPDPKGPFKPQCTECGHIRVEPAPAASPTPRHRPTGSTCSSQSGT